MKIINKPRLWNYKTGIKAGHLRQSAKEYLSFKLKDYYKRKAILKSQFIDKTPTIRKRTRTQVCYNSNYRVSLRAIGFNKQTEDELEKTLQEFLNSNKELETIPFNTSGYEKEEIDKREDANLNENIITIELNIRGQTTYTEY